MWRINDIIRFLALLCALFFSSQVLHAEIVLTDTELRAIRKELSDMRTQIAFLKSDLTTRETQSKELTLRLATLETRLQDTALKLENSEASLIQSIQDLEKIRRDLETLKKEYLSLNQYLARQKAETRTWKTIALISSTLAAIFGVASFAGR